MMAASVAAAMFNANGGINGRGAVFTDFHADHAADDDVEAALMRGTAFDARGAFDAMS